MKKISDLQPRIGMVIESVRETNEARVFMFKENKRKFSIIINDQITNEQAESIVNDLKTSIERNTSLEKFEFDVKINEYR